MTSAELIGLPRWVRGLALAAVWVGVWGLGHLGEIATHASVWYPPAALKTDNSVNEDRDPG